MQPTQQTSAAEVPSKSAAELIAYDSREERAQAMERDGFVFLPAVLSPETGSRIARMFRSHQKRGSAEMGFYRS